MSMYAEWADMPDPKIIDPERHQHDIRAASLLLISLVRTGDIHERDLLEKMAGCIGLKTDHLAEAQIILAAADVVTFSSDFGYNQGSAFPEAPTPAETDLGDLVEKYQTYADLFAVDAVHTRARLDGTVL
jgi:hypothetical protein